jgi:hypothetical protein
MVAAEVSSVSHGAT